MEEDGHTGALRLLKMSSEQKENARSLIDAMRDAAVTNNRYNEDFLTTIAAFAIEGYKNA